MNRAVLEALARERLAAQDEARVIERFSSRYPGLSLEDAYEIAKGVHEERLRQGRRAVGRKIGFTNPAMWAAFGVSQPIWGYMYDTTVHDLGRERAWSLAGFTETKIEPEIVLHFGKAPPAGDAAQVLACIDWIAPGFEIVQSPFPAWKFDAADAVTVAGLHAMLLIGERKSVAELGPGTERALERFRLMLLRNGEPVASGSGADVLGSPLAAIAHLVATLQAQPAFAPIAAGDIVTTGTITVAQPLMAGERWSTEIEGIALDGIEATFR